nr:MAG TPA: Portal [Caudoviricetes sp.]
MAYSYYGKNIRPFTAVCNCNFGRKVIKTNKKQINKNNIVEELYNKAISLHNQNATEINYLDRYYSGDQPILYRRKVNRPEVNNKLVVNLAYEVVERKVAEICAEPIQYVLRGTDDKKSEEITELNVTMDSECKQEVDIEICRWRSICGTAYRFIGNDSGNGDLLDESDFSLSSEDPRYTFVVYYSNNKPAFSCQIREGENNEKIYFCYTANEWFDIRDGKIFESGINGNRAIPVIEYPNNSRRLSDVEITILITDAINKLQSDRINGVEQFVSAWVKFVNCEIDKETYAQMRQEGALVVKSNNGGENKADVDVMTNELNQTEGQVVFDDLFERFLSIQGLANRSNNNSGGDTGNAVSLRNGHYDAGLRTAINEPILKKSERMSLRIILNRLRINKGFTLMPSDIEIHINHNKIDNLLTKSEALKMLLEAGVDYKRAIKTVDLFSDSEAVALESKDRMEYLYPTSKDADVEQNNNSMNKEVVE